MSVISINDAASPRRKQWGERPKTLTRREMEVLDLARLRNADIARTLFISPATVKNHWSSIARKLGTGNRTEAALIWREMRDLKVAA